MNGEVGKVDAELFISQSKYDELKQNNQVPCAGDILVTARGTLGTCYVVKSKDYFYFQDGMITWLKNVSQDVVPLFIVYLFKDSSFRRQIDKNQTGSTVAYLSISMLKNLLFPSLLSPFSRLSPTRLPPSRSRKLLSPSPWPKRRNS